MTYRCIVVDPPWPQQMIGYTKRRPHGAQVLPYRSMTLPQIHALPIHALAEDGAHLWLWTTNQFLEQGYAVMRSWGFKCLAPIHWVKPSGVGSWFVSRTQTLLMGYRKKCVFPLARYQPNIFFANPGRHSQKPEESFRYIESISPGPRVEIFARTERAGWDRWGNEVECSAVVADILGVPE